MAAGGRLSLHGRSVTRRWMRLARAAAPGDTSVRISGSPSGELRGIQVGDRVMIASTSYNQYQTEVRRITGVVAQPADSTAGAGNLTALVLDSPLRHPHAARGRSYPVSGNGSSSSGSGGSSSSGNATLSVDLRAEVALLSSNVGIAAAEAYATITAANGTQPLASEPSLDLNRLYGSPGANDGPSTAAVPYGARLLVVGTGSAQLTNVVVERCGQLAAVGQEQRPCVLFQSLSPRPAPANGDDSDGSSRCSDGSSDGSSTSCESDISSSQSYMYDSAIVAGVGGNVAVLGSQSPTVRVELYGNVLYGSYAVSNVQLLTTGNHLYNNLALGAIAATNRTANSNSTAAGATSGPASVSPANFLLSQSANWVEGNVAAGSDRFGFVYQGMPCTQPSAPPSASPPASRPPIRTPPTTSPSPPRAPSVPAPGPLPPAIPPPSAAPAPVPTRLPPPAPPPQSPPSEPWDVGPVAWTRGSFQNNTAHSCLVGAWLRASVASSGVGCTALSNFTAHTNWDYGLLTLRGIDTDVRMYDVALLDNRHAGAALLRQGGFTERAGVSWRGGLLAGRTSPVLCALCASPSDAGCHQRLTPQSYNRALPYTPSVGFVAAAFALGFSVGPDGGSTWDAVRGYPTVFGHANITGVTVADFEGASGCGGGSFAFANNPTAPDASHPHFLRRITLANTRTDGYAGFKFACTLRRLCLH